MIAGMSLINFDRTGGNTDTYVAQVYLTSICLSAIFNQQGILIGEADPLPVTTENMHMGTTTQGTGC